MKRDLDALMQANSIDALLVTGPAQHNPAMVYLTGGAHLTRADLIKKRGEAPLLFHAPMERDEAAHTGLATRSYALYPESDLLKEAGGNPVIAQAIRYCRMFADAGITAGRVALYGEVELSTTFPVLTEFQRRMPAIELVGDLDNKIIVQAMMTKDETEIERIRRMGKITTEVVGMVADYLTSQDVQGDMLVDEAGQPVTIGRVKGLIDLWLAERGAENPHGAIFAIGRDGGVPHSAGSPDDIMRLGQPIVFDIFPCEKQGGYFYDFTRTWCLGYAPDHVQGIYAQVRTVFETIKSQLKPGTVFSDYQRMACEMFEDMGHPTTLNQPGTEEGYVHGLGHGVGLHIHERPSSSLTLAQPDILVPGSVVTIEPGLYYPERGMGVRLEDTLVVHEDGTIEVLAGYPTELVLPMKK